MCTITLTSAQTANYIFLTVNITFKVHNVLKEQTAKTLQNITFERRLSEGFQDQRVLSAANFSDKHAA